MATLGAAVSAVMAEHLNTFQQFIDLDEILLCLMIKNVIQNDEYHELMEETRERRRKQALFLLKKIPTAGDGAFLALLECLNLKHRKLAETLLTSLEWERGSSLASQGGLSLASQGVAAQPVGPSTTWDRIRENRMRLRDKFNLDVHELLRSLSDKGVFTLIEGQQIRGKATPKQQFDEFFDLLMSKNPRLYYPVFLKALTDIDRKDVRDFLEGECSGIPQWKKGNRPKESTLAWWLGANGQGFRNPSSHF
ncbi:unnamed protein product [Darwinula stevensoni]|uniref:CARD domain-containing protein n=1 Tax=Darwinula stevensoni TaxID=69355 RepID=A0A7R8X873_9CRUS|nr:unnamed protein product [Darwinula stevensoni]CAG0889787.1 unnamed protein product [Darwinula stevensoni]